MIRLMKDRKFRYIIAGFAIVFMTLSGGCGGSSSDDNNGNPNPVPEGCTINISGDITSCFDFSSPDCIAYNNCLLECYNLYDFDDPAYETCINACNPASCGLYTGGFIISVTIENTSNSAQTYTIAAGTQFMPGSNSYQPMMTIDNIVIIIPAGETVTECIPVYCLALHLDAPDDEVSYTDSGMVTTQCLLDILNILKNVDIDALTNSDLSTIQGIIWDCTDSETGVSQADWDWLNSL